MQHSETIFIQRPVADVWALVGSPSTWPDWLPGVQDANVEGGTPAVGARMTFSFRGNPQDTRMSVYEPERALGFTSSQSRYDFAESFTLEPQGDATTVTMTMSFQPTTWWMKAFSVLLVPIKGFALGSSLKKELRALKERLEGA